LLHVAAEEVADGREVGSRLRGALLPVALDGRLRLGGRVPGDGEQANLGGAGRGDGRLGVIALPEPALDVRLAGADPDLTDKDVLEGEGVLAGHGQLERAAGLLRRQLG